MLSRIMSPMRRTFDNKFTSDAYIDELTVRRRVERYMRVHVEWV